MTEVKLRILDKVSQLQHSNLPATDMFTAPQAPHLESFFFFGSHLLVICHEKKTYNQKISQSGQEKIIDSRELLAVIEFYE